MCFCALAGLPTSVEKCITRPRIDLESFVPLIIEEYPLLLLLLFKVQIKFCGQSLYCPATVKAKICSWLNGEKGGCGICEDSVDLRS